MSQGVKGWAYRAPGGQGLGQKGLRGSRAELRFVEIVATGGRVKFVPAV